MYSSAFPLFLAILSNVHSGVNKRPVIIRQFAWSLSLLVCLLPLSSAAETNYTHTSPHSVVVLVVLAKIATIFCLCMWFTGRRRARAQLGYPAQIPMYAQYGNCGQG